MADKDDGGPAFPSIVLRDTPLVNEEGKLRVLGAGMSLRDYFAAAALTGIMSDDGMRPCNEEEFSHMARRMYQVADAMIKVREE